MKDSNDANSIADKVLKSGGAKALIDFVASEGRDMPAVKLTRKELQALRGGFPSISFCSFAWPLYENAVLNGSDADVAATTKFAQSCGLDVI